ncbi:MAG: acylneuraminate cytidylyltransferase family protein [Lentisphaeria bacterium]|nr:acylneuraminate cytidylyltransferase family protein [Lentisphaeria bacterium]
MKYLAVITARSGSKGLRDKNILPLGGIPLSAWTIRAALESGVFDEVHFSTDSEKYAAIAREYGASVPFLRDAELATDGADTWDVVKATIGKYRAAGKNFDAFMLLQPTVPFRNADDIREAVRMLEEKNAKAVVSVTEPEHSPFWCAELPPDGDMRVYHEKIQYLIGRQKLPQQWILNGAIYLVRVDHLLNARSIYESGCYAYKMPRERSFDIDDRLDFDICEFLATKRQPDRHD